MPSSSGPGAARRRSRRMSGPPARPTAVAAAASAKESPTLDRVHREVSRTGRSQRDAGRSRAGRRGGRPSENTGAAAGLPGPTASGRRSRSGQRPDEPAGPRCARGPAGSVRLQRGSARVSLDAEARSYVAPERVQRALLLLVSPVISSRRARSALGGVEACACGVGVGEAAIVVEVLL